MKYASLILNAVLAVAVAVLYYLHFSTPAPVAAVPEGKPVTQPAPVVIDPKAIAQAPKSKIMYVNSDSLLENYDFYTKKKAELEAKGRRIEKDIASRTQTLQYDMESAQRKAQAGGMTEQQMQEVAMRLRQKEENLYAYKEEQLQKLGKEEQDLTKLLNDNITNYLEEYSKQTGADYVFGYTKGGGLLFATPQLDITKSVVEGLNERYKAQGKK